MKKFSTFLLISAVSIFMISSCGKDEYGKNNNSYVLTEADMFVASQDFIDYENLSYQYYKEFIGRYSQLTDQDRLRFAQLIDEIHFTSDESQIKYKIEEISALIEFDLIASYESIKEYSALCDLENKDFTERELLSALIKRKHNQMMIRTKSGSEMDQSEYDRLAWLCHIDCDTENIVLQTTCLALGPILGVPCQTAAWVRLYECKARCKEIRKGNIYA